MSTEGQKGPDTHHAPRVLLVEDHTIVRQGTRLFLESKGVPVVGEAADGRAAIEQARALHPDVVIMDIQLPELTGIEATRRIRSELGDVRVLVLSAYDEPAYINALLDAGADGFVLKTAGLEELLRALNDVAAGLPAFDAGLMRSAQDYLAARNDVIEPLTPREVEVLTQAARGLTNKEIGRMLYLSDRTVQGHLQNVYQKLGVTTRTEAVTKGLSLGLIVLGQGGHP